MTFRNLDNRPRCIWKAPRMNIKNVFVTALPSMGNKPANLHIPHYSWQAQGRRSLGGHRLASSNSHFPRRVRSEGPDGSLADPSSLSEDNRQGCSRCRRLPRPFVCRRHRPVHMELLHEPRPELTGIRRLQASPPPGLQQTQPQPVCPRNVLAGRTTAPIRGFLWGLGDSSLTFNMLIIKNCFFLLHPNKLWPHLKWKSSLNVTRFLTALFTGSWPSRHGNPSISKTLIGETPAACLRSLLIVSSWQPHSKKRLRFFLVHVWCSRQLELNSLILWPSFNNTLLITFYSWVLLYIQTSYLIWCYKFPYEIEMFLCF